MSDYDPSDRDPWRRFCLNAERQLWAIHYPLSADHYPLTTIHYPLTAI